MPLSNTVFVTLNAENQEHERNQFQIQKDKLLQKTEEQKHIIEGYRKQIEDLQNRAISAFILWNKSECLSRYINKEIDRYSKPEQTISEENFGGFTQESIQQMHQEKLKLTAQLQKNYKIYKNNTL